VVKILGLHSGTWPCIKRKCANMPWQTPYFKFEAKGSRQRFRGDLPPIASSSIPTVIVTCAASYGWAVL
jgi:hypothetical protein